MDGISLLMVLLTSIIIYAGVFASWTVATRSQEFYALLLALVTGVYGVFVSLDLFVFFLFYELAVLPMYLLIGIWGSTGEVRPRGIFAWAYRETGVGTKEYAAMKLTLYLLFGSAFILVGIFALYIAADATSVAPTAIDTASASAIAGSEPRSTQSMNRPSRSGGGPSARAKASMRLASRLIGAERRAARARLRAGGRSRHDA